MFRCVLILLFAISAINLKLCYAREVPYTLELNKFNVADDNDKAWIDWDTLSMKKVSRNKFGISGTFHVNRNMGNEQKIAINVFSYNSEQKKRGPLVFEINKPVCQFIEEDDTTYPGIAANSNMEAEPGCPFPKGTYTIDNYEVDTTFLPDNSPKTDYLIVVTFKDGERPMAGYELDVTLK